MYMFNGILSSQIIKMNVQDDDKNMLSAQHNTCACQRSVLFTEKSKLPTTL
jgi:hypothetical protein